MIPEPITEENKTYIEKVKRCLDTKIAYLSVHGNYGNAMVMCSQYSGECMFFKCMKAERRGKGGKGGDEGRIYKH